MHKSLSNTSKVFVTRITGNINLYFTRVSVFLPPSSSETDVRYWTNTKVLLSAHYYRGSNMCLQVSKQIQH